ncbi:MAG TPA: BBP7 family outer membrane beta-barrel protein [Pirellulales bacterium]|jgi:hypothetical protein
MKAPFWGKCGAVVGTAVVGAAVLLQSAGGLRAADPTGTSAFGPDVAPLGRASDGSPSALDYNLPPGVSVTAEKIGSSTRNNLRPPALVPNAPAAPIPAQPVSTVGAAPGTFPAVGGPVGLRAIDSRSAQLTADPQRGGASNAATNNSTSAGNSVSGAATQTAFKQYYQQRQDPASMDQRISQPPYASNSIMRGAPAQPGQSGDPSVAAGLPPSIQAPTVPVDPPTASEAMNGPYAPVRPGGPGSTCASCQGGGACGPLPPGAGDCPNCGGWKPGSCRTCDPNGSCILQRLACCLSKPYPDISNGCVDFCHSWIFHEDDFWLFSDHKCVAPGCGPYPYGGCPTDGMGKGIQCGCNNCGPCVAPPDLYFSLDAMVLTRDNQGQNIPLVTSGGATALMSGDFDFDWRVGPYITAGYRPTKKDAWELTYFGLQDWNENETVTGAGNVALPGVIGTLPNFIGADSISVNYQSEIQNGELNYLWKPFNSPDFMWLVGFRGFHLDERLNFFSTVTGTGTGSYDTHTNNDLLGLQGGIRLQHRFCDRFCMDGFAKAGIYRNRSEERQSIVNDDAGVITSVRDEVSTEQDHWAYVTDAGMNLNFFICRNWCVTGGYNVIWADQLALAPNQLDFTNDPNSGTVLNHTGSIFMHGAHLGVACRW